MKRIRSFASASAFAFAFAASVLALGACSEDDSSASIVDAPPAADAAPDALVGATAVQFVTGDTAYCLAIGADYANNVGTLAAIALPSLTVTKNLLLGAAGGDPVIRADANQIYVVNRVDANVTVIDKATFTVLRQFSTGASSNPQDIAVVGDKAFVTAQGTKNVQVWDLAAVNATAPVATVDLSSYDAGDMNPDMTSVAIADGKAFVTLDLLDYSGGFPAARGNGKIVVIDTTSNAVVSDFDLTAADPINFLVPSGSTFLVDTAADFSGTAGCIEIVETTNSTSGGCLVTNEALGGTPGGIDVAGDTTYVTVAAPDFKSAKLVSVSGGTVSDGLVGATQLPGTVAVAPTGVVVYADGAQGGIRVYDPQAHAEVTSAALDIGLAPVFADGIVCLTR